MLRAPIKWYGGKGNIKHKILPSLMRKKIYCEHYGGSGALLFGKPPHPIEIYNDINGNLVNLFRHLQDKEKKDRFKHRALHTLYSFDEFKKARRLMDPESSPEDRAWAMFVVANQSFSGQFHCDGNWSRTVTQTRNTAMNTNNWTMRLTMIDDWHKRLLGVQIDNKPALETLKYWDSKNTIHYLDPPYLPETRAKLNCYENEMTKKNHEELIKFLLGEDLKGDIVISGYDSELYRQLEDNGWRRCEFRCMICASQGNLYERKERTEVIWMNFDPPVQMNLF